ncbi:MAG: hypothetical protein ABF633_02775 [Clostridium sp.]|uniref:hypothetical protein n=1 Tax=Clostridium sp. TaxID=1506 RepID=UPI0039EAF0D1
MILILSEIGESSAETQKKTITDVFGFGKAVDSLAKSFGKLLEKIPSNKLSPGMAFVVIVLILFIIFICVMFKIDTTDAPMVSICVGIFFAMFAGPFVFLEIYKEMKKIK